MIEIIEHGTKQITKCKACGCTFSFESEDVKHIPGDTSLLTNPKTLIVCPQCKKEIVLATTR